MSGHSKWATIKRKKSAADAKRGAVFTRVIKEITVAARLGGGDPDSNPRLRLAINIAKKENMPASNIDRAVKKGTGELPGVHYEAGTYEAYGPGGAAILMDVLTDNKKRTVADIRHILTKHGGSLGEPGCVMWMFENKGTVALSQQAVPEETLYEIAVEFGAEDIEQEDEQYIISIAPESVFTLTGALEERGYTLASTEIGLEPTTTVNITGPDVPRLLKLLEVLEELEDVEKVYSNFDINEEELASVTE